ncbi:MAG: hypothetical protein C5B46_05240 [Proteobacteria bacterium]|nr:MAG: hypothetical protein C5B46_05240 [Pseudomonadota bacterium]
MPAVKVVIRFFLLVAGTLVLLAPVAAIVTFLLSPLWSWIEATFGLESIGHSGPADWCFVAVYTLLVGVFAGWMAWRGSGRSRRL